jgi:hypothetical protein
VFVIYWRAQRCGFVPHLYRSYSRRAMCGRGGASVSLWLLIILIVAHHIWNFVGLSWNWAGLLEPMQTSSVFLAAKPASAPVRVRSLYASRTPSTANDPNSMAAAAPKWAQKTITLPPQRRGCHLITPKVYLFPPLDSPPNYSSQFHICFA